VPPLHERGGFKTNGQISKAEGGGVERNNERSTIDSALGRLKAWRETGEEYLA